MHGIGWRELRERKAFIIAEEQRERVARGALVGLVVLAVLGLIGAFLGF